MKSIAPFIVMLGILVTLAVIIIALFNYRLKKRILDAGPVNEHSLQFLQKLSGMGIEALKWGLILLSGGLGLVILEFIPFNADESPLPYGIEAIFIATGFLVYYYVARKTKS